MICRLRFAGFDPVGHVLGAAVVHLGYVSRAGKCSGSASYTPQTDLPDGGLLDRYLSARTARRAARSTFSASDVPSTSRKG